MSKKTLLLNSTYEPLSFLSERRALKLIFKDKCDIINNWNDDIVWQSGKIKLPAIIKLKYYIRRNIVITNNFSRKILIKRDKSQCKYCFKKLTSSQITIDHIIPKSQGGITSFDNCVVSCLDCNYRKGSKTLEQSGLILLEKPFHPLSPSYGLFLDSREVWHPSWNNYLKEKHQ